MIYYRYLDSPLDPLLLVSDGLALIGLYMREQAHGPGIDDGWIRDDDAPPFAEAARQLAAYFDRALTVFDLPLHPRGTSFQQRVWNALLAIPYGATISYGELARRIGQPGAARAVGLANGRNPIALIIPCHRVIGATGRLTGYGGGLARKQALLDFEAGILLRCT